MKGLPQICGTVRNQDIKLSASGDPAAQLDGLRRAGTILSNVS